MLFSTDKVEVDMAVFNASRITKLYGTMATKGANTPGKATQKKSNNIIPKGKNRSN